MAGEFARWSSAIRHPRKPFRSVRVHESSHLAKRQRHSVGIHGATLPRPSPFPTKGHGPCCLHNELPPQFFGGSPWDRLIWHSPEICCRGKTPEYSVVTGVEPRENDPLNYVSPDRTTISRQCLPQSKTPSHISEITTQILVICMQLLKGSRAMPPGKWILSSMQLTLNQIYPSSAVVKRSNQMRRRPGFAGALKPSSIQVKIQSISQCLRDGHTMGVCGNTVGFNCLWTGW